MKGPLFYSKILLFGEYGIIKDSKGLSIPYNFYKGALKYSQVQSDISSHSNTVLKQYYNYLKTLDSDLVRFDLDQMADGICEALEMPKKEQRRRMRTMQKRLSRYTVQRWAEDLSLIHI